MSYNINTKCQFNPSSTLGTYSEIFLNDGSRGMQSTFNYWNNSQKGAIGVKIECNFRQIVGVKSITLQLPIFDITGPYTLNGIQLQLFLNNNVVYTVNNLVVTGGINLAGCIDAVITLTNVLNCDKMIITFGNPNPDGYVFMGEIIIICVDNNIIDCLRYLEVKGVEIIRGSIQNMDNKIHAFPPQLGSGYNAFWLRDYAYMLEGCAKEGFYINELLDSVYMFTNSMRSDGAQVDTVQYNMNPIYQPGFGTMGTNPVLDGACFFIDVVYQTYIHTKNIKLIENLINSCEYALKFIPLGNNGIPYISPVGWDRCPYGFTDSVRKQGEQLFDGLLLVQAKKQMLEFYDVLGRSTSFALMQYSLSSLVQNINNLLWDDNIGLYRACTGQCSINYDVWGSAFAVRLNVPYQNMKDKICNYFNNNYNILIQNGGLRHIPAPTYWEVSTATPGTYQNGAYWPCAIGWFVYCLDIVNPSLADKTIIDMVQYMQINGIYEWYNGAILGVINYTASLTLPIEGIKSMLKRRNNEIVSDIPSNI